MHQFVFEYYVQDCLKIHYYSVSARFLTEAAEFFWNFIDTHYACKIHIQDVNTLTR